MSDRLFAYIPARGGSVRVPRKNIKTLGGVPVLARVVANIRAAGVADIAVSSEDAEILAVAQDAGAETLEPRSVDLTTETTGFLELVQADVPRFARHFGTSHVLFALSTAALVDPDLYARAVATYFERRPALLLAATRYPISPFWAMVERPDGKGWWPLFPEESRLPSQKHPPTLVDAGLFLILDVERCRGLPALLEADPLEMFVVPDRVAVDVDTPEDWAEMERRFLKS